MATELPGLSDLNEAASTLRGLATDIESLARYYRANKVVRGEHTAEKWLTAVNSLRDKFDDAVNEASSMIDEAAMQAASQL